MSTRQTVLFFVLFILILCKCSEIIGIDLGSTSSSVAVYKKDGEIFVIPDEFGFRYTPNVIGFDQDKIIVGEKAKLLPGSISKFTDHLGKSASLSTTQKDHFSLKEYSVKQLTSFLLTHLKDQAENYLGHSISRLVVSVPTYFDDKAKSALKEAATMANLTIERIIPNANAIGYAYDLRKLQTVLVFHLGGSSCEATVLDVDDGIFENMGSHVDLSVGGIDLNERLLAHVIHEYERNTSSQLSPSEMISLRSSIEQAKILLSILQETSIEVHDNFSLLVTRQQFEEMNQEIFSKCTQVIQKALEKANISTTNIDQVLLSGGSTMIPHVRQMIQSQFSGKPVLSSFYPSEVSAMGAAIIGGYLSGMKKDQSYYHNFVPTTFGIASADGIAIPILSKGMQMNERHAIIATNLREYATEIHIPIIRGEQMLAKDNTYLYTLTLKNVKPVPRGQSKIKIEMYMDSFGELLIIATDLLSNSTESSQVINAMNVSFEQVEQDQVRRIRHEKQDLKKVNHLKKVQMHTNYFLGILRLLNEEHKEIIRNVKELLVLVHSNGDEAIIKAKRLLVTSKLKLAAPEILKTVRMAYIPSL